MQCSATSKRSGQRCKKDAIVGRTKCHIHGGKTPRGAESPHYRGLGFSKHLPTRLQDTYEDAERDPELLKLRKEIALTQTRIVDLLSRLDDDGGNDDVWNEILGVHSGYV